MKKLIIVLICGFLLAPFAVYVALPLLFRGLTSAFFKKQLIWKGRRFNAA